MKYRMYSIVLRHLSGIQKGIQHGHSKDEFESQYRETKEYKTWLEYDKTVVLLETNSTLQLLTALNDLMTNKIRVSSFIEPDLGNIITSISFIVEESVWDRVNYPDASFTITYSSIDSIRERTIAHDAAQMKANIDKYGDKVAFLKDFLIKFELAKN